VNLKIASLTIALALTHSVIKADECMATINGPDGFTLVGQSLGGDDKEITTKIEPGERFIAVPPYDPSEQTWRVYLKSGIHGMIDRSRIRLLPDEPLIKLNYSASKPEWQKLKSEPVTENDQPAWEAKRHGVDYYDTLIRASEGDLAAIARFDSFAEFMDGAAAEGYEPERWALFHLVGDENLARYLKSRSAKVREEYRVSFGTFGNGATDPISKPKPYIKRYFPKTYKILFGKGQ
jgi:hypothetical protein